MTDNNPTLEQVAELQQLLADVIRGTEASYRPGVQVAAVALLLSNMTLSMPEDEALRLFAAARKKLEEIDAYQRSLN